MGCVYKLTSPTGRSYIGKTSGTAKNRFVQHVFTAEIRREKTQLSRAIRKFGSESFKVRTLRRSKSVTKLDQWEKRYISKYETFTNGYNMTQGGEGLGETFDGDIRTERKHKRSNRRKLLGRRDSQRL